MTRVTLCVDALGPEMTGIGRYTWELCQGLVTHSDLEPPLFYGRNRIIRDLGELIRGDAVPKRQNSWRSWLDKRELQSTIVHGPNYFLPAFAERGIITVHDLSVFKFPETHPAARIAAFEREFDDSLSRAAHIITDSETVRQEVIASFGVSPTSITAVPLGVGALYRPRTVLEVQPILAALRLESGSFGLCVSTLEPRKKIVELLAAWRGLPPDLRAANTLVLTGGAGWRNEHLREQIQSGEAEGWLRYLGFVDEANLPALYAAARLFVYPSIYEGFGLPPLEAMASGVPLLVSQHSCLPELCGSAARYIDPDDPDSFRASLIEALGDPDWRAQSAALGPQRAAEFTWSRCVDRTVDVYRSVAS